MPAGNESSVRAVSVHSSNAIGVYVKSTPGLAVSSCVVHKTKGSSVDVTMSDDVVARRCRLTSG